MNLQKTILALSLSLSSFVCMAMQPHHNQYVQPVQQYIYFIPAQSSFAKTSEGGQQYLYAIPVQQYQNLMHIQHQEQLQRQQQEAYLQYRQAQEAQTLLYSMPILLRSIQRRAEQLTTNTVLQHELQYPRVMPIATKPSKVLARRKQNQ